MCWHGDTGNSLIEEPAVYKHVIVIRAPLQTADRQACGYFQSCGQPILHSTFTFLCFWELMLATVAYKKRCIIVMFKRQTYLKWRLKWSNQPDMNHAHVWFHSTLPNRGKVGPIFSIGKRAHRFWISTRLYQCCLQSAVPFEKHALHLIFPNLTDL